MKRLLYALLIVLLAVTLSFARDYDDSRYDEPDTRGEEYSYESDNQDEEEKDEEECDNSEDYDRYDEYRQDNARRE